MLAGSMSRYLRKIVEAQKHKKLTHEIQLIVKRRQGPGRQRSRAKVYEGGLSSGEQIGTKGDAYEIKSNPVLGIMEGQGEIYRGQPDLAHT
jgi:hypothetical protein